MYVSNLMTSSLNACRILHITHTKFCWMDWVFKSIVVALAAVSFDHLISSQVILVNAILRMSFHVVICGAFYLLVLGGLEIIHLKKEAKIKV